MSARRPIFFSLLMVTGCVFLFGARALSVRAEQTTLEEVVPAESTTGEPVRLQDSEVRVKEVMPKPKIRLQQGARVYYLYQDVEIWLYKDQVVVIRPPGVWGGPSE